MRTLRLARTGIVLVWTLAAIAACGNAGSQPPRKTIAAPGRESVDSRFLACPGKVILPNREMSFAADQPPTRTRYASPQYPKAAADRGVHGVVILEVGIDGAGMVHQTRVVRSIPLLDDAAAAAVCAWRFTPARVSGQPIAVVMTVAVSFPP